MESDNSNSNSRLFNEDSNNSNPIPVSNKFQMEVEGDDQIQMENGNKSKRRMDGEVNGEREEEDGPTPQKKQYVDPNDVRTLLPDLDRFWTKVDNDPNDFTAWTQLLQYVDGENQVLAAREAYDKFLSKYPYCYGYWKKYADYEKRKGSLEQCEKVFRRGLKAISLSVDLWIHYLNYVKSNCENQPESIRKEFEAALVACGMEFRSDKLWEHYIQWERENQNFVNVLKIYDRVLATPTQNYQTHLQNVKELVNNHKPSEILNPEEHAELKKLALASANESEPMDEESEDNKIRELIIERRTEIYKKNEVEIMARWTYEEAIKRPYFHVKALEKGQLRMWKEYLEFEIAKGDSCRTTILFERCLIACALYEEYWIKYVRYLMSRHEAEGDILTPQIEDVFARACTIHHPNKPWINLYWAAFEEGRGNVDKALEILERLDALTPGSLIICYRRINVERRRGNIQRCVQLFEHYVDQIRQNDPATSVHLSIKFGRFLFKVLGDYERAKQVLQSSMDIDESTRASCTMALVDLGLERSPVDIDLVLSTFNAALASGIPDEQKVTFAHRKIEFLEDYGTDVESVNKAQDELQKLAKIMREKKANLSAISTKPVTAADKTSEGQNTEVPPSAGTTTTPVETSSTNGTASYGQYDYSQQYNQYGSYANWNYQTSSGHGYGQEGWNAYQGYFGGDAATGTGA